MTCFKEEHCGLRDFRGINKLLEKAMSSIYHLEEKTFIEASCNSNTHTGEKVFLQSLLLKVCELFLFTQR